MVKIILYRRVFGLEWYNFLVTGKLDPYEKNNNIVLIIGGGDDEFEDGEG